MKDQDQNFLWDPAQEPASADLRRLEIRLQEFGARARGLAARLPPVPETARVTPPARTSRRARATRVWRGLGVSTAAAAMLALGLTLHLHQRLSWETSRPWPVQLSTHGQQARHSNLHVGERLVIAEGQHARVQVAGIGRVELDAGARLRLVETGTGQHRVELQQGRMHARIWAPPGHFGVFGGGASVLDLGCEFELDVDAHARGHLSVHSGWVQIERGGRETLVPAGYSLHFDTLRVGTPLRIDAGPALREAVAHLDQAIAVGRDVETHAQALAAQVGSEDMHTLLSLLTRHPELAQTDLYPPLAMALGLPPDDTLRAAWAAGDTGAINRGWQRLPQPPKAWWRHWRDAF